MSNKQNSTGHPSLKPLKGKENVNAAYIALARREFATSSTEIEIDDDPAVSVAEGGAWVSAWLWVSHLESHQSEKDQQAQ
ncbi:MAG: hypothetical protein WBD67_05810 [Terracidiphilus sp.]